MRERERNGVRLGQPARDLDGKSLGKVVRLFAWGFETRRGPPILFGRSHVIRYDELRAVRDGVLVVSRSDRDLLELAAGEVPHSWRIPTPPAFPTAATPAEARHLVHDVATGRVTGAGAEEEPERRPAEGAGPARDARPLRGEELREYVRTRGQGTLPDPAGSDRR